MKNFMKKAGSVMTCMLVAGAVLAINTEVEAKTFTCDTVSEIHTALKNAVAGDTIAIEPGTYVGSTSSSGDSSAYFASDSNGTASKKIKMIATDSDNPPVLKGTSINSGYIFRLQGDYWEIRDIEFNTGKKGIMLDEADNNLLKKVTVTNIGEEGIHFRDGSSNNTVQYSEVNYTGLKEPKYGEGIYVGSDIGKWDTYEKANDNNKIIDNKIGPYCMAEPIDIKEGTTGTIVADNTMYGKGVSGENYADSFMDVKGDDCEIYGNTFDQQSNSIIVDAIQVHERADGWGFNNEFYDNIFKLSSASVYCINVDGGSAIIGDNERTSTGNMYTGNYEEQ